MGEPAGTAAGRPGAATRRLPPPQELYVEVTNRCNSLCLTCPITWGGQERKHDLGYDEFVALTDQFPRLRRVVLHGIGEPTLNRDLPRLIAHLKRRSAQVLFNSNAIALPARVQEALIGSGLDQFRVSLDAARPETYLRVRGVPAFERVVANLGAFVETRRRLGAERPRISLWFTGMRDNVQELPDLIRLAARAGVDGVYLQRLVFRGQGMAVEEQSIYRQHRDLVERVIAECEGLAAELGVAFEGSGAVSPRQSILVAGAERAAWRGCTRPWRLGYVTANGNCLPCCIAPFTGVPYQDIVLGNTREQPFELIWNGERYREFRRRHATDDDPPECCRRCGHDWSL
jgi:radical SAM protein with 4Fe4S-binding SPASM domain